MKIALSQLNVTVGDIVSNKSKIIDYIKQAADSGADLVVFGELSLSGAPLYDLVNLPGFTEACYIALAEIAVRSEGVDVFLGLPVVSNGYIFNAAVYLSEGKVKKHFYKSNICPRDELPFFTAAERSFFRNLIECRGHKILVVIGEDITSIHTFSCFDSPDTKPDYILHLSARPYARHIIGKEIGILKEKARRLRTNLVSVNLAGGNTDVVYYGASVAVDERGHLIGCLKEFEEDFSIVSFGGEMVPSHLSLKPEDDIEELYKAVAAGLRDYCSKAGFSSVCVGLSGGIDSAVVAAIATDVLGKEQVRGLMMPSQFSSDHSIYDAVELSLNLEIRCEKVEIEPIYHSFMHALFPIFENRPFSVAEENIQARIRCVLLMALSNKFGCLLLNTSNKSEGAVGYGTLYGDDIGGLSILGDLYKTEVYALADYINRKKNIIPLHIIQKAPSAELAPGQKDSDSLPAYELLDQILYQLIEENKSFTEIVKNGFEQKTVVRVMQLLKRNEYKRYQFCPTLRMSCCPLGEKRKMPVVNGYMNS